MRLPPLLFGIFILATGQIAFAKDTTTAVSDGDVFGTPPASQATAKNPAAQNSTSGTGDVVTVGNTASSSQSPVAGPTTNSGSQSVQKAVASQQSPEEGLAQQPVSANSGSQQATPQDPPQLAQTKEQAWNLINSGNQQAAQQFIKEALKQNPDDKDLQAMAVLGERHQIVMDQGGLQRKIAALGGLQTTGALGGTAAQETARKPILASALGMLGAGAQAQLAVRAPAALKGALSEATFLKMRMQDYSGAEKDLTETITADPANWLAYRLRAFTRRFMKKIPEAESDADRALELNPKDAPSHDVKGLLALDQHDPNGAIVEAGAALALNPKDSDAFATRAQAEALLGQKQAALADFKAAADLDPQFGAMYRQALYASGAGGPGLSRVHALYAAAAGLALLFFGLSLVTKKQRSETTKSRPAMRAEDNVPSGVNGFRILRRLGQGGMGVVYEAYDESLQRKVALKRMREEIAGDPRERKRFIREARLVAGLKHPGIVEIYSLVDQAEALYLVFEYLPGETLDQLMERRGGRVKASETLRLSREIAEALDYAHSQGVVHQDLKPSNVLVNATGAKVMDFGIARRVQDTLSTMSRAEAVGTPAYMAPEQEQGVVTPKADLFAFGVLVYEMLAGKAPFGRGGGAFSKLDASFPPLSEAAGLPKAVDAVIASALNPDASQRPLNACAFVSDLESALAERTPA